MCFVQTPETSLMFLFSFIIFFSSSEYFYKGIKFVIQDLECQLGIGDGLTIVISNIISLAPVCTAVGCMVGLCSDISSGSGPFIYH